MVVCLCKTRCIKWMTQNGTFRGVRGGRQTWSCWYFIYVDLQTLNCISEILCFIASHFELLLLHAGVAFQEVSGDNDYIFCCDARLRSWSNPLITYFSVSFNAASRYGEILWNVQIAINYQPHSR